MARFVNPDNSAFEVALNSKIYVDKTGLLEYTNSVLNTSDAYICNSRPRRFGKSYSANMLAAYYSKGADSEQMFSNLEIAKKSDFHKHLNKYDVIHLDIQWFLGNCNDINDIVPFITNTILEELKQIYPEICMQTVYQLSDALSRIREKTGHRFIIIIDEWDVLLRDMTIHSAIQETYIQFLRSIFKGTEPTKYIQLAYLTGILPIRREKTQSALNNFDEFTMLSAGALSPFIGFTENEVKSLCVKYQQNFEEVKRWYDGYKLNGYEIYNPRAVVSVMQRKEFKSYWSETASYETIVPLINMDYDGLKTDMMQMLSGQSVKVNTFTFKNDAHNIQTKDEVFTYMVHLGYLGYEQRTKRVFIPNEEIRQELSIAVENKPWNEFAVFQKESEHLLQATLNRKNQEIANQLDKIHLEFASIIHYNDENSLSSILCIAYLNTMQYYFKPVREMPTGYGFADFIYVPKPEYINTYPALVIELKWNKNVETTLQQIKDKKYTSALTSYTGRILLVGITYNKKTKKHECLTESFVKE